MPDNPINYKYSLSHAVLSSLCHAYIRLTGATTKITWENRDAHDSLAQNNRNFIYAVWHSRQVFLAYAHKNRKVCALVSKSKDGEYMARVLDKLGITAARGSTSKGGHQALIELMDAAKAGFNIALTPDGPRGPKRKVQQGIIYLAQKTAIPILPVSCGLTRKLTFSSWDEFQVPLPFGAASIVYGKPIYAAESDSPDAKAEELENELNRITDRADEIIKDGRR